MIRDPKTDNITINVKIKNMRDKFLNKDVTSSPMGDNDRFISFWDDDKRIRVYPIQDVEYFEFVEN